MRTAIYSFSLRGAQLSKKVAECFRNIGYEVQCGTIAKYAEQAGVAPLLPDYKTVCASDFATCDVLVFIGAAGIAVRAIAPHIRTKVTDPAVISLDECANFVIPLLAGHIGGANELARVIAAYLGGTACVTTATDVNGLFAVDEWASRNHLAISDMYAAKDFAAALVNDEQVGLYMDDAFTATGALPKNVVQAGAHDNAERVGMAVSVYENCEPFAQTLRLVPKAVYLGIGCRRDTPLEKIEALVLPQLEAMHLDKRSIAGIASVDLKKDEQGLLAFARKNNLPAHFYTADELNSLEGDFTPSAFVKSIVGVSNVCERSAVFASNNGRLLLRKTSLNGVTLAVAVENIKFDFNKTGLKTE